MEEKIIEVANDLKIGVLRKLQERRFDELASGGKCITVELGFVDKQVADSILKIFSHMKKDKYGGLGKSTNLEYEDKECKFIFTSLSAEQEICAIFGAILGSTRSLNVAIVQMKSLPSMGGVN